MALNDRISSLVAFDVFSAIDEEADLNEGVSDVVEKGLNESLEEETGLSLSEEVDVDRIKRYIDRGMQEVKNLLNDLNFELNEALQARSVDIKTIDFNEGGQAVVEINRIFELKDSTEAGNVATKSAKFTTLRPDFAKYITFNVLPPGGMSPEVTVQVKVKIPKEVVEDMVGGPANENWAKAGKAVETYVRKLIRLL